VRDTDDAGCLPIGGSSAEWMQVSYVRGDVPRRLLDAWNAAHDNSPGMHFPPRNPFVPEDRLDDALREVSEANDLEIILDDPRIHVDYIWDAAYNIRRSAVSITLTSSFLFTSMTAYNIGQLYQECLECSMQEVMAQARDAGFTVEILFANDEYRCATVTIQVSGYTNKIGLVVASLCKVCCLPTVDVFAVRLHLKTSCYALACQYLISPTLDRYLLYLRYSLASFITFTRQLRNHQ
jgi:secreted Zn-dependent insulinase-like peptidase